MMTSVGRLYFSYLKEQEEIKKEKKTRRKKNEDKIED